MPRTSYVVLILEGMAMENELKTDPADLIEQDPVLHMLGVLIGAKSKWLGTASALLDQLIIIGAETKSVMPNDPRWPKNAAQLSHHLRTARPLLDEMGIVYEFDRKEWKRLHILYEAKAFPAAAKAHFAKRAEAGAKLSVAGCQVSETRAAAAGKMRRDAASTAQAGAGSSGASSCTTASNKNSCAAADDASATAAVVVASNAGSTATSPTAAAVAASGAAGEAQTAASAPPVGGTASGTTDCSTNGCAAADADDASRSAAAVASSADSVAPGGPTGEAKHRGRASAPAVRPCG